MRKSINSATQKFEDQITEELVLDAVPTVNSFNGVTSDGVARAVAGASGKVPQVTESDNGKVLKAIYDEGGPAVEWGDAPGGVPEYSATDEGKVLGVVTEGVEDTPALGWVEQQGGASYTAGDGISIEGSEIKVRLREGDNALKFTEPHEGGDYAPLVTPPGTPSSEGWKALKRDNAYLTIEYDDSNDVTHIGLRYLWDRSSPNPLGITSEDDTKSFDAKIHLLWVSNRESTTDLIATSDAVTGAFTATWDASQNSYTYSLGTLVGDGASGYTFSADFYVAGDHSGDFNAVAFSSSGSDYSGVLGTVQSSFLSESHVLALQGAEVFILNGEEIPGGDLYVDVDQTYDASSANAQSGVAVAGAIAGVNQVPASTSADENKVLTVNASGSPVWAAAQGGGGGSGASFNTEHVEESAISDSGDEYGITSYVYPAKTLVGAGGDFIVLGGVITVPYKIKNASNQTPEALRVIFNSDYYCEAKVIAHGDSASDSYVTLGLPSFSSIDGKIASGEGIPANMPALVLDYLQIGSISGTLSCTKSTSTTSHPFDIKIKYLA